MPTFLIGVLITEIRHRWQILRQTKDGGYLAEAVLGIALLAALAIAVLAIIATKITDKANSINLNGTP